MEQSKQLDRGTWYSLAICLLCFTLGIVLLLGPQPELFVGAALWVAILVGAVWVKLYLVRRRSQRRQGRLLWHSKGWLDDRGFFSMTTLGQTFVKWSMIGAVEITDQLIGLKPHGYEHTAFLVGRNQFGSDTDWNRALEIVHRQTDR
jgi:hypothetical protein